MDRRGSADAGPLSYDRSMRRLLLLSASLVTLIGWTAGCEAVKEKEDDLSPDSITVGPSNPTIEVGDTQQLTVMGQFPDDSTSDVTALANYTTATNGIATVSESGLITGVSVGTVTITASYDFRLATTLVTVVPTSAGLNFAEIETNDTPFEANDIGAAVSFSGGCSDIDTSDFYSAAVTSGTFAVSLAYTEGAADTPDIDLYLYDSDLFIIALDETVTNGVDDSPAEVSAVLGSAMTVYVEAFCFLSTSNTPYFGTVTRP